MGMARGMKVNFVTYTRNNYDGSVSVMFFQNKEQAEACAEDCGERYCEDVEEKSLDVNTFDGTIELPESSIHRLLESSYRSKLVTAVMPCIVCGRELVQIKDGRIVDSAWGGAHTDKQCIRFVNGDWKKPIHEWKSESR
jgi:hypothetical protein